MINKEKLKKRFKKTSIRFAFALAALGVIAGGLASLNFMGTTEQTIKMNKFEFSTIEISKASRILKSLDKNIEDEDIENSVIEWFMYKETYNKIAKKLDIKVSDQEIADYVRSIDVFKNDNSEFSIDKYKSYLKVNVIDSEFYEELIKDEILINKLKSIIDPELFNMTDPVILTERLNKEYKSNILVADTTKMTDFSLDEEFENFLLNDDDFSNLMVNLRIIKHNENLSVGEFNVIKNNDSKIDNIIEKSNKESKKISIKELYENYDIVFYNNTKYHYKDSNTFYQITFDKSVKNKEQISTLKNNFQFIKKGEFIESYIEQMVKNNKTFNQIYETQDYFDLRKEDLTSQHPIFSNGGKNNLLEVNQNDVFYISSKPFYISVKVDEISDKKIVEESDFKDYYKQNMTRLFLNILDKKAANNY